MLHIVLFLTRSFCVLLIILCTYMDGIQVKQTVLLIVLFSKHCNIFIHIAPLRVYLLHISNIHSMGGKKTTFDVVNATSTCSYTLICTWEKYLLQMRNTKTIQESRLAEPDNYHYAKHVYQMSIYQKRVQCLMIRCSHNYVFIY